MSTATPVQFLFIDAGVTDIDSLLANVDPAVQVVRLNSSEDGLTQIARALAGASNVETVHVVSHGGPGALTIGNGRLDAGSLDTHADALATIRTSLSDSADLLLYGCNVAEGEAGRTFIEMLADATGADVAASTDPTGSALLGGDWALEAQTGAIEAAPLPLSSYEGLLGADSQLPSGLQGNGPWTWGGRSFQTRYHGEITDNDPENPLRAGNKWDRYALSGVTAGTTVYVYMGNSSTVDDYLQIDRNGTIITQNDDGGDGERSYDAYVSWVYQPGDVIRATTYSSGYRGTYSLYIGTSTGTAATPTDIGNAPAPAPPPATAPTFTDGYSLLVTYTDTGATDTFTPFSGTLTASDSTPTGSLTFSNTSGAGTYGTLAVASNGSFAYTPNAAVINALAAGQSLTDSFTVRVTDGGLATTKVVTVNVVGANDAPTLASNASIPAVTEDVSSAANRGLSVSAMFAPRFADVDNGASLGGIIIVGDASSGSEGAWQYSTNGGTSWFAVGSVSAASGLALPASALVRFAPAADWNGTPGSLSVHAADNVYAGGYSAGATRVTFDTSNDAATSGVSAAPRTISTSVTAVNDAPTFTSAAPTHAAVETSLADASSFAVDNTVSGTLTGTDIDSSVGSLAFSIRGGTLAAGSWSQTGLYGTLTLDATTHEWTYVKFGAINALSAGENAHDVFQFRVTDSAGASSLQTLDVTLTGTNDVPLLGAQIADQVFAGGGTWRYQVPAGSFTDAEGSGLTYTVEVLDNANNVIDTITASTGGNAGLPSSWLTFDEATRTFSGDPTPAWGDAPVTLRVTATDPGGLSVIDTFGLTLSGTANQPPVVANPLSWQTVNNPHETFTLQVGAAAHGSTLIFDGLTVHVPSSPISGSNVATAVVGGTYANWNVAAAGQADTVRFTAKVAGPLTDLSISDFTGGFAAGAATLTKITEGTASQAETGTRENFTLQLSGILPGSDVTLIFDGKTYNITSGSSHTDVVAAILTQGNTANWAVAAGLNPDEVVFTFRTSSDQPDVSNGDFTGTYELTGGGTIQLTNYVQGTGTPFVPAVAEVWEITFDADEGGTTVTFDGTTVTAGTPATAAEVAAAILTAGNTANYAVTAHPTLNDTVVYTATNVGTVTDVTGSAFTGTYDGAKTVTTTVQGGWSYTFPANTFSDPEGGTLTYTAWLIDGSGNATQISSADGDTSIDFNAATRTLSGDGSALASNVIEIRAQDPLGLSVSARMPLYIDDGAQGVALAVGNPVDTSGFVFDAGTHSFQLPADAFVHADLGGSLTFSATLADGNPLPPWLSFDPTTGVFSGNPPHGATSPSIVVTAADGNANGAQTAPFTLNVGTPNDPLVLVAPIADQAVAAGALWSQNFAPPFSNPDGNADGTAVTTGGITYTATANGQPLSDFGLTLTTEANGSLTFNGNPSAATPYLVIVVTGTETAGGTTATTSFTLNLNDSNAPQSLNANNPGAVTITGTPTEGQVLSVGTVTDDDGITGTPVYQWQVSSDSGATWEDITGARGQASTITLAESEAGRQVRLQVLYNDDGGVAEAPLSNVVSVANLDTAGSVSISGIMTPGETLTASIADGDGVTGATPTYQWYRGSVAINGATHSAYTLTNADGGANMRVDVSYVDDHGTTESRSFTTSGTVQLGIVAPVAVNDVGSLTEASGVNNAVAGTNASGNLLGNDTDVNNNIHPTLPISGVRAGGVEGVGEDATLSGNTYTVDGLYGTLTVNRATGAWTYAVNQGHPDVEALFTGDSLQDRFNYTLADDTGLFDTALLAVTINGANDSPTLNDLPSVAEFTEDIAEAIRTSFSLVDPDGGSGAFSLRLTVTQGTLRGENLDTNSNVTVTGTDTTVLTLSGPSMADVQAWLNNSNLLYTSAPNQNGNLNATLTYSVSDDGGTTFRDAGTTALNVASSNNPPVIDLGGASSAGNNHTTIFRPRGGEVAVVTADVAITDIDPADTLTTATVTLTTGAYDNDFGTTYETLRSTAGNTYAGSLGQITITGNGTTQLVLTGTGTHADYEAALRTVVYNNTNPNAFSGDRLVTISVSDADGFASNTASFATATPNNAIAVGQRIFLNGTDTGFTVGQVIDNQHFVASGPLAGLAPGVTLAFWAAGAQVTTGTQAGPVVATTTVDVQWTPVIDMSGDAIAGRDRTVTYTEGGPSVALATADASITDQDGNIATVVVSLSNHPDGSAESLSISSALVTQLATLGITVSGNNSHQVTLSGNRDASYFQIGLRGVRYANTSENPDTTDRVVNVTSTDVDGNTGVGASTTINIHSVNDAPSGSDATITMVEDNAHVFATGDFGFSDVEGNDFLAVTLSTLPAAGSLTLDGMAVIAGQSISASDINAGRLVYTPVAERSGNALASFTFRVQDNAGTAYGGVDIDPTANTLTLNVTPVNDAPVMTAAAPVLAGITEDQAANAGQSIASLVGAGAGKTGVADSDTLNNGGAGHSPEAVGQGVAITATHGSGGTWQFSTDGGGSWSSAGAVSTSGALLLRSTDLVRFVPDEVHGSTASFDFVLWDGATGTAGSTADATTRGGATAFSTGSDTATITVAEINDAPTGSNTTLTVAEDGSYALALSEFGYGDIDGNAFVAVTISTLPASGSLQLNGVAVTTGQSVSVTDIQAGLLVFHPAADVSGNAQASFGFRVQDDGGTALGGQDVATTERTVTFNVTPTNDAPVATAAAPRLTTIGENDTANAGQLVSDFVGSGAGKTGVADVDTLNNGGAGNAPEGVGQGIAIHATANTGPTSGGAWQYSTDGGSNWQAVGAVSDGSALLLRATDRVRFLPDAQNATEASFSYYVWDGASGSAGTKVDASTRGDSTAFSTAGDIVAITVTPANDAPALDLDGGSGGTGFTTTFRPRGEAVAIVGANVSIGDADVLDAATPDTISSATITLASGAVDNLFGTIYETLSSTAGNSYNGITITGNGGTTLTLTGVASRATYEAALRTIVYNNTNPNAFTGDRTIEISVRDTSVSTGDPADRLDSNTAVTTVQVPWTPVVDMNGDAFAGRNHAVSFTERGTGVAIATPDASLVDQDGNIQRVTVTLTNPLDGSLEKLFITSQLVTQLLTVGITVTGNDSHAITLSGNRDGSAFQLGLRAIRYVNDSNAPSATDRVVSVESLDMQNNTGVGATTTISIVTINDAPVGTNNAVTLNEDTPHAFAVADFAFNDLEGHALSSVILTTLPSAGTIMLNGVAVTAGQEVSAADIAAGHLVYTPALNANDVQNGVRSFTFQVRDAGGTAIGGIDLDSSPNTLTLNITPVNDLPTGTVTTNPPSVAISGNLRDGQTLTANFDVADVDYTAGEILAATTYQWQTRAVPGGTWTNIAGATANLHVLGSADVNLEIRVVVSYVDTMSSTLTYTSDISAQPAIVGAVNGDIALNVNTPDPVLIVNPTGDVTVTNTGTGPVTVDGAPDGGTLTVTTTGPVTVSNPDGDISIVNNGPGTVTVTGLNDGAELTAGGNGPTTVSDPEGSLDLVNNGPATVTVDGLNDGETLDVSGNGPTTVSSPDGDLTLSNAGPGTATVTGLNDGAALTAGGNGPTTVSDPDGSLDLVNQGPGTVTVDSLNDGETLNVGGNGPTTVANPDGDLAVVNAGPGTATVTGLDDDATLTTSGNGPTTVSDPEGSLDLANQGPGTVTVDSLNDGETLSVGGNGPTTVANPDGDLTVVNAGPGTATVTGLNDGATLNTGGTGPTTVANPDGDLEVANAGPATTTITGLNDDATLATSGNGPTTVSNPEGSLTLANGGTGTVTVDSLNTGETLNVSGTGPTTVANPDGDLTVVNAGPGTVTVTGLNDDATLATSGNGPTTVSNPEGSLTLANGGTGTVTVDSLNTGETLNVGGNGPTTLANPDGDLSVNNSGPGTVTVTGLNDDATLATSGNGPTTVSNPEGSLTLANAGAGTVTVDSLNTGETLNVGGNGPTTVANPDGDLTVVNAGPGTVTVTGLNDDATLATSGNGPTTVSNPEGSLTLANAGAGTVTVDGLNTGERLNVGGNGPTTVSNPDGDLTVVNAGPGTVTVTGLNDDATLATSGNGRTTVSNPDGSLTLANAGAGTVTVDGLNDGEVLNVGGNGPTTVANPDGNLSVNNAGPAIVTVTGLNDDATLATSGNGPTTVSNPDGSLTLANAGAGTVTVDGLNDGEALNVGGSGPTTVTNPDGNLNVNNAGPATVTVTGLNDDAVLTTGGNGPTVVNNPEGSLGLLNQGPGTVTVNGLPAGETLTASGSGPTTLADPAGNLTIANAGPGRVTATGVNANATVTTSGNGPVTLDHPEGALNLVNQGPGTVSIAGFLAGETLTTSGSGPTRLDDPAGNLTLVNAGPGMVSVGGVNDGATVTTSGNGPVMIDNPEGAITLANNGPGTVTLAGVNEDAPVTVTGSGPTRLTAPDGDVVLHLDGTGTTTVDGLPAGASITADGNGPLVVDQPVGDVVLHHTGSGTATVSHLADGATLAVDGSGPTQVSAPLGDVTVRNTGTGLVTTAGVADGSTITYLGSGPQALDLSGFPGNGAVSINNTDGASVAVLNAPGGATVGSVGSGDVMVSAPTGDIHVHNAGTGTVHVDQVADGATVTKTGTGPAVIAQPNGSFTLANDAAGLVTVRHVDDGETVVVTGTGPVAVESSLAAGQRITIDTSANSNVRISNDGAGVIDVAGNLQLDAGDPMHLKLNGNGTTALTVAGGVSLSGTPLDLQLDSAYAPHLGDRITLIDNDGSDAVTGTFAGLPEGAPVYLGGVLFRISYAGGTGNDVVLTRVNDTPTGSVTISGTPTQGQTLTASHTLGDTDGLGMVRYQWMVNGIMVAVGSSYVLSQADVGHAVTAIASYTDSEGTVESRSSAPTQPVANINDAPTGQVLIDGSAVLGQTLVASNTLADIDGMGAVTYQWQADGVDIAGATGASHVLGRTDVGHVITAKATYTDAYGAVENVVSSASARVADGNGVAPSIEQQVPGLGGNGVRGDGNGDGVQDSLQPAVVSAALDRNGAAGQSFVTLVVDSVNGKPAVGSEARLVDFEPAPVPSDLPSWAQAPVGEIGFTADVGAAGVTRTFSLYVDANLGVNGYWARNAEGTLVNLASQAYGGSMVVEGDKLRLDFQITEGGEFDEGPAGDTTVVSHGMAGHASLSLIGYTIDQPVPTSRPNIWD